MRLKGFLVATGLALTAVPAAAQDLMNHADPQIVADMARGFGSVELTTHELGDPLLIGRIDGTRYAVYFYECTNGADCQSLMFYAGWESDQDYDLAELNAWNQSRRFGKAYLDEENDPAIEMSITLRGGITRQNLDDNFDWWRIILREFRDEVVDR